MNLYDQNPNVPQETSPLWFDLSATMYDNLKTLDRWMAYYSGRLPRGIVIDEASILTRTETNMQNAAAYLREAGWEEFNTATDLVFTNPFGTRYTVEYRFFSNPHVFFRLELMRLTGGFSPLHRALLEAPRPNSMSWPVPHLSFKPQRRDLPVAAGLQTWRGAYGEAVQYLRDNACIHAQSCQSTYGQFGYFLGNDAARQVYIKPRINLRDGEVMHSMCTVDNNDGCLVDHSVTRRPV